MALTPRLEVRQAQGLALTPQLMQSIRLLQLNHVELQTFVETELERNPLLERDERRDDEPLVAPDSTPQSTEVTDTVDHGDVIGSAANIAEQYDTDVANVFPEQVGQDSLSQSTRSPRDGQSMLGQSDTSDFEDNASSTLSLSAHLRAQLGPILTSSAERLVAQHFIDNLNDAGYLNIACDQIAAQLGAREEFVLSVLEQVQKCDPIGVFARDVGECLALQLREKDRLDPMMQALLDNLDLVAAHDLHALGQIIGADREDIMDMLGEIRALDPRPGRAFDATPMQAIVADVFVRQGVDGDWALELNSDILPRVLVNRTYYANVTKKARDQGEKSFLVDCLQTANWLTKSLDQRAQTILKVATEITRQQDAFLTHGIAHLRPMTLKTVAEAIEMHESTVSRVTTNKYISTPRGLFEMKYFFTTALSSTAGGAEHSAESVRHRIKQLIDAESPKNILSDDTIAAILKREQEIEVARRTVAKYREGMHIPSSVIRRRQKRAMAPTS